MPELIPKTPLQRDEITIDAITETDPTQISEIFIASRADALPTVKQVWSNDQIRAWIRNTVVQLGDVWVAKSKNDIVGFLALVGDEIDHLYVSPDYYRQGIGSRLLDKAKEASPTRLCLFTFQVNARARNFYESHGFRAISFNDGTRNEEDEPDILYEWRGANIDAS